MEEQELKLSGIPFDLIMYVSWWRGYFPNIAAQDIGVPLETESWSEEREVNDKTAVPVRGSIMKWIIIGNMGHTKLPYYHLILSLATWKSIAMCFMKEWKQELHIKMLNVCLIGIWSSRKRNSIYAKVSYCGSNRSILYLRWWSTNWMLFF